MRLSKPIRLAAAAAMLMAAPASAALADAPKVLEVSVSDRNGAYVFNVTISHPDTGWEHYADAFTVHAPDGTLLGTRTLFHPHVDEQPFTRSLTAVQVPVGLDRVLVRAHDSVHGPGEPVEISLPGR